MDACSRGFNDAHVYHRRVFVDCEHRWIDDIRHVHQELGRAGWPQGLPIRAEEADRADGPTAAAKQQVWVMRERKADCEDVSIGRRQHINALHGVHGPQLQLAIGIKADDISGVR